MKISPRDQSMLNCLCTKFLFIFLDGRRINARASCAEGRVFEYQAGQILHSIANGSPPLSMMRRWAP